MKTLAALLLVAALPACTTVLHGHQSSGSGATAATGASVTASAGSASVRAQASFGSPAPAQGAGGQVVFSRGASAVLVLGLVLAETVNYVARGFTSGSQPAGPAAASIADTCSCYRPQPEPVQPPAHADGPGER
jgi:hypothetical protein